MSVVSSVFRDRARFLQDKSRSASETVRLVARFSLAVTPTVPLRLLKCMVSAAFTTNEHSRVIVLFHHLND
jgi:hypothetical protein